MKDCRLTPKPCKSGLHRPVALSPSEPAHTSDMAVSAQDVSSSGVLTDSPDTCQHVKERSANDEASGSAPSPAPSPLPHIWGVKWRSSTCYITTVVAVGITTDLLAYQIVIPVLPYRLQALEYSNISALTSWLLFAYSAGIFVFTFPVAWFFHRNPWRREPLIAAVVVLELALILFMLATPYWAMVIARVLQGASGTVVWTIGFALICENVDHKNVGRQLGFAFTGVAVGTTIAPPIGGALYHALGWHAPFIFVIIVCAVDLLARLLVIERKDLIKWEEKHRAALAAQAAHCAQGPDIGTASHCAVPARDSIIATDPARALVRADRTEETVAGVLVEEKHEDEVELSAIGVLLALVKQPRGTVAFMLVFIYGLIIGALDPTFTLHVQTTWNKDSDFVGLLYLAAAAPTFFVGPIAGALADKYGSEWLVVPCLLLSLPWAPVMLIGNLPGFAVAFALLNTFTSVLNSCASLEMAITARQTAGISEIHEFAALNVAFSVSSAVGAVAGGQIYDHVSKGWTAVIWFCFACLVATVFPPFMYTGSRPLLGRMLGRSKRHDIELDQGGNDGVDSRPVPLDA